MQNNTNICALKIDPTMKSQNATNILFERTKTNLGKTGFFFFFLGKNDRRSNSLNTERERGQSGC